MNELTTRKRIRALLMQWFGQCRWGDQFTTDDCCKYVNRYLPKKADPATIKREMRFLRAEGYLNYKPVGERREKLVRII
jgi:hypothetical protein